MTEIERLDGLANETTIRFLREEVAKLEAKVEFATKIVATIQRKAKTRREKDIAASVIKRLLDVS